MLMSCHVAAKCQHPCFPPTEFKCCLQLPGPKFTQKSACLKLSLWAFCVLLPGALSPGSGASFWTACTAGEQQQQLLQLPPGLPLPPPPLPNLLLPPKLQLPLALLLLLLLLLLLHPWLPPPPSELLQLPWTCSCLLPCLLEQPWLPAWLLLPITLGFRV